jgi:hypothetical protein
MARMSNLRSSSVGIESIPRGKKARGTSCGGRKHEHGQPDALRIPRRQIAASRRRKEVETS